MDLQFLVILMTFSSPPLICIYHMRAVLQVMYAFGETILVGNFNTCLYNKLVLQFCQLFYWLEHQVFTDYDSKTLYFLTLSCMSKSWLSLRGTPVVRVVLKLGCSDLARHSCMCRFRL